MVSPAFTPKPLMLSRSGPESLRRQARTSRACSRASSQGPAPISTSPLKLQQHRRPHLSHTSLATLDVDALLEACNPEEMLDYLQEYNASSSTSHPLPAAEEDLQRTPPQSSLEVFANLERDLERTPRPSQCSDSTTPEPEQESATSFSSLSSDALALGPSSYHHQPTGTASLFFPCPPLRIVKNLPDCPSSASNAQKTFQKHRRNLSAGAAPMAAHMVPPIPARTTCTPFEVATQGSPERPAYSRDTRMLDDEPSDLPYRCRKTSTPTAAPAMSRSTTSSRSSHSTGTTVSSNSDADVFRWSSSAPSTAPTSPASSPRSLKDPAAAADLSFEGRSRSGSDFSIMSAFSGGGFSSTPSSDRLAMSSSSTSAAAAPSSSPSYAWDNCSSTASLTGTEPAAASPTRSSSSSISSGSSAVAVVSAATESSSAHPKNKSRSRPTSSQTTKTTTSTTLSSVPMDRQGSASSAASSSNGSAKSLKSKKSFKSLGKLFRRTPSQGNLKAAAAQQMFNVNEPMPTQAAALTYARFN